jgi:hypothetical protein
MQDSTVRQQCDSLAELLVTKGANLLDLETGKTIGERAGWPNERVRHLVLEQHALMQAIIEQGPSDNDETWTCDAVGHLNAWVIQRMRLGELGAARDVLERSGETLEEMAKQYNQHTVNVLRDALRQQQPMTPENTQ